MTHEVKTIQFGFKYWLLSCSAGLGLFLLISFCTELASLEKVATALLWPGAAAATVVGAGAHDLQGFLLYILGNCAFYCTLFLGVFRLLKIGAQRSSK